jgi:Protein of unknown function (DUF1592)/Protein of unknown function (DUF1588)/Protein of unknown function (DUF1595)/Protein of unknown function (DUF1585)/Protein of unknown function (DUF1587)
MVHPFSLLDRRTALAAFAAVAVSGCMSCAGEGPSVMQGTGGGGGINVTGTAGVPVIPLPPSELPPEKACTGSAPGPRQLRRLTASEFAATVRDLFRDQAAPSANIFNDQPTLGFTVDSGGLLIQDLVGDALRDYAETVASWAVQNHLSQIASCMTMDSTCRRQVIGSFGKRAFRAPLATSRIDAYEALFAAETSFSSGVEAVVAAMLQSPYFLYRTELGPAGAGPGSTVTLTPYEVASGLSYLLTGSMPDDQLMQAADTAAAAGSVLAVDAQLGRLLADPRVQDSVMRFASGWLSMDRLNAAKDPAFFTLTDANRADMAGETRAFFLDTFATGTLSTLLSANYTFLNTNMAQWYGFPTTGLGTTYTKVSFGAGAMRDPGILAQAALLTGLSTARTSSPTQRGKLVRARLLCQPIPPPPPNVNTNLPPPAANQSTRAQYEAHVNYTDAGRNCPSCHTFMDRIGFGFEHYDGVGKYRTMDTGQTVDSSGVVVSPPSGGDKTFNGVGELATWLAADDDVKRCLVRYWSYFAYGSATWDQDACTYTAVQTEAAQNNFALKSVLTGIVHAPHFSQRAGDQP